MAIHKLKFLVFLVLLLSFICLPWRASKAADAGDASSALCEYGIRLYKEGQLEDAIHELKKALIINPYNLKAKNYLIKIYSERNLPVDLLWDPAKRRKISDYENQIKKLRDEVRDYQRQLSALNRQNLAKEAELERLSHQLQSQKELFGRKEQDLLSAHKNRKEMIAGLEEKISRLQKEADDYQKQFAVMNDLYTAKQAELERLNRQLQDYTERGEKISGLKNQISRLQKEADDYQKQLTALNSQYLARETELEKLKSELNSQKELLDKKAQELLEAQREQKKYLADLASKHKELAKLKIDYETRLRKMEAKLKAKEAEEDILIEECLPPWTQGEWLLDDLKEGLPELECEFDKDFIPNAALKLAEKSGLSSWEELKRELSVLMPSLESDFSEEDFFYTPDQEHKFDQLETQAFKDADMESLLSDLDN